MTFANSSKFAVMQINKDECTLVISVMLKAPAMFYRDLEVILRYTLDT